ncbi:MAG: GNAT family N-acetyltransferase [Cytophagaceae bacterium]
MSYSIFDVDFKNPTHQSDFWILLNTYATDIMGGGTPLSETIKDKLIKDLASSSIAYSFIAYDGSKAIGLLNSFLGYSTFYAAPLLNIHDLVVIPEYRGKGISTLLLQAAEDKAKSLNCCKLTLEVLENNTVAQRAYHRFGFASYELDPSAGKALFFDKKLTK